MNQSNIDEVIGILKALEMNNSRLAKESILSNNKNNELLKRIFVYVYDPYRIYGIGEKSINPFDAEIATPNDIIELFQYLEEKNTGKDIDKSIVNQFLFNNSKYADWYTRMLLKNLRIGVSEKTINKIWDILIPVFDVMLAEKWLEQEHKVEGRFIITKKLDGVRCVLIIRRGEISVFSRQGKPIYGLEDIIKEAGNLPDNMVYDGELLLVNDKNLSSKDLYRETVKVVNSDNPDKKNIQFNIFDCLQVTEFMNGKSITTCEVRKNLLHSLLTNKGYNWLVEVPILYVGEDKDVVIPMLRRMLLQKQEGIMINLADRVYECKRTDAILKLKDVQEADLRVVGFYEGKGKLKGSLGGIFVEYKDNIVKVGGGFKDIIPKKILATQDTTLINMYEKMTRKYIWEHQDEFINKIVKILYTEETSNSKNDLVSLRYPRFDEWRFDKTEPNI
jgi:DNA ligase-1